jgi:hypothetical protein
MLSGFGVVCIRTKRDRERGGPPRGSKRRPRPNKASNIMLKGVVWRGYFGFWVPHNTHTDYDI